MIVSILCLKHVHYSSKHNDDLLTFGIKSLAKIIPKVSNFDDNLLDKIFQLFLHIQNPRIRLRLGEALQSSLSFIQTPVLEFVTGLNQIKRGLADMEQDCDKAIAALQDFMGDKFKGFEFKGLELNMMVYNILHLCKHEEFSLREYSLQAFTTFLALLKPKLAEPQSGRLLDVVETHIVKVYLNTVRDDLALKTVLQFLKHLA
mmetsp:Transcript_20805/g.32091  ORF Transcript_20805/g.32091 Transcript_20805/m.32091 type:complete len:203 (+) Transcript_20805:2057-2665(+)